MSRLQRFMSSILFFWLNLKTPDGKFVGTSIRDWVVDGYARMVTKVLENLESEYMPDVQGIIDNAEATGKLPAELQPLLDTLKGGTKPIGAMLGQSMSSAAVGGIISSTIGPWLLLMQYEVQKGARQYRFDPMIATLLKYRYPGTDPGGAAVQALAHNDFEDAGWTFERENLLFDAAQMLLQADELTRWTLRFQLAEGLEPGPTGDYIKGMYKLGYKPDQAKQFFEMSLHYPTPDELVRWQAREVFEPDMIARYGLDAEGGAVQRDAFYRAGMTDEQINNYWRAHWEHASWTQVTDMLHRGLLTTTGAAPDIPTTPEAWRARDAQGEAALYDYYKLVEIPPFWRDLLTRISFVPLTRVDIRRMHKLGVLDVDALYSAYRTHGYNDANAQLMTDWTVKYNQGTATAADRDLTKADILRMYRDRLLSQVDAHDMLIELGYGEDEAGYLLDLYAQSTATKTKDLTVAQVKSLYQLGIRTKAQVTPFLEKFGYDKDEIMALYDLWDWEKPASTRIPTRTDFDKFIAAEIIDLGDWSEGYAALGYDMKYQEWYFALLVSKGLEY